MLLALDVGGTNFIMMETGRGWDGKPDMASKGFLLPKDIMTGTHTALFDHIAKWLYIFLDMNIKHLELPLGFTFPYPY